MGLKLTEGKLKGIFHMEILSEFPYRNDLVLTYCR